MRACTEKDSDTHPHIIFLYNAAVQHHHITISSTKMKPDGFFALRRI